MDAATLSFPSSRSETVTRRHRSLAAGLMLCLATTAGQALPLDVTLNGKLESAGGEYIIRVENRDHETSSFQWFIDERPVTATTVDRAGELVFFAPPAATATYRVVVTDANGAQAMGVVRLDPGAWRDSVTPVYVAPSRVSINRIVQ